MVSLVAGFLPTDPCELVDAALSCDICLSGRVDWRLDDDPVDPMVQVDCPRCGHSRTVALLPDQALRLSLHRPSRRGCTPPMSVVFYEP